MPLQTIFVKNNVKMTFRGWGVKTRDVSVKRNCGVMFWGGGGGIKHNVTMTLFFAKIVWTSPLTHLLPHDQGPGGSVDFMTTHTIR